MPKRKTPKKSVKGRRISKKIFTEKSKINNGQTKKFALFLILIGAILITIPLLYSLNKTIQLTMFTPPAKVITSSQLTKQSPIEIAIPAINLYLPIEDTLIKKGIWQVSENGASYLATSARPGQKGAIILYGHNTNDRFGPIRWLTPGKTITLKTKDGKNHVYKIQKTIDVYPDQMQVFDQKEETLILYTCDGFADLKRFIVLAKPTK